MAEQLVLFFKMAEMYNNTEKLVSSFIIVIKILSYT